MRERDEANFIQEKGKESERKLGKEIYGGERGERRIGGWMERGKGKEN
jgi:hypothetical protein